MNTKQITQKLTPFETQIIDDLWEIYMYNIRDLNDADVDQVDTDDVKYFQKWLNDQSFIAPQKYLPQNPSQLSKIIKYCVTHTQETPATNLSY